MEQYKEKFDILENEKIDKSIYYYLENLFNELKIEIIGDYEGKLFDLMKSGRLEGWCFQTTETAALFMKDDTTIYRGNLYFDKYKSYYHSFIEFNYDNNNYVFDPCLSLINTANLYFKTFDINVKGKITAKEIKEYFLDYITNIPKKETKFNKAIDNYMNNFMKKLLGDDYLEKKQKEIVIYGEENPYHPMYRNGSGYKDIVVENNKVKSLTVHYYING